MATPIDFRVKNGLVVATTGTILGTTQSLSSTTGALQVAGGAGIVKDLYVGGTIYGNLIGTLSGNADTVSTVRRDSTLTHYLTFVSDNNTNATGEAVYTTSSFTVVPSTGNVGIGTTDPQRKLTVQSDSVGAVTTLALYNANTTNGNGTVVSFRTNTTGTSSSTFQEVSGFQSLTTDHNHLTRNTNFSIFTDSSSTGVSVKLTVTGDGKVGIGTTSPTSTLSVNGSALINSDTIITGGSLQVRNGIQFYLWNSDTTNFYSLYNNGASSTNSGILSFIQGGVGERLRLDNTGTLIVYATTNATSTTTGALQIIGGAGIGSNLYVGGTVNILTGTNTVTTPTWEKWRLVTVGTTSTARQGSDNNGLNFTTNAIWTGTAWQEDYSPQKKFAYIQHLGNGRHEFRTAATGTGISWTAGLLLDETSSTFTVPLLVSNTNNATSTVTGALQVVGGAGIGGNLYVGNSATILSTLASTTTIGNNALYVAGGVGINNGLYVKGQAVFQNDVLFVGSTTFVYSTQTVYTDNILNIHVPAGGIGGSWTVNDGEDIGLVFHNYFEGADNDSFLGWANDTGYLEWYSKGLESTTGTFTGTTYGIFKTGGIILTNTTASSSTSTGALTVAGGVGIGGNLYVGGTVFGNVTGSITTASTVNTVQRTTDATHFLTFVDANNASAIAENVYTTSSVTINPGTGNVGIGGNPGPVAPLTITKTFPTATGAESFGQVITSNYSIADTSLKQSLRVNAGGQHTAGTLTSLITVLALNSISGAGGTTTNAHNYWSRMDNSTNATVTNAYNFWVDNGAGSGGPQNLFGLYIGNLTKGSLTNYAIYTAGTTPNYFGGNVGIGVVTPTAKLDVSGGVKISSVTTVTDSTAASSTNSGALQVVGGAGFGGNLYVGGTIFGNLTGSATTASTINTIQQTSTLTHFLTFVDANNATSTAELLYTTSSVTVNPSTGEVDILSNLASTSTTTGALVVTGGVGIGRDVWIGGGVYATTKSFLIPHPTKPGMKLRYGSLEGPENGVYVRGRLTGSNVIELPEYWTKLIDPDTITVNLTPIGRHQNLYVEEIIDNKIVISNSNLLNKEINCFYTVFAERRDVDKLQIEIL